MIFIHLPILCARYFDGVLVAGYDVVLSPTTSIDFDATAVAAAAAAAVAAAAIAACNIRIKFYLPSQSECW